MSDFEGANRRAGDGPASDGPGPGAGDTNTGLPHDAPASLPRGRMIELPGRGTAYVREAAGPGTPADAPTLVLLHGWTVTSDLNWGHVYQPLGEQYPFIAMDLRGHGRGIRGGGHFRLEACADDVVALADVLGIQRIIPVGYSMGGAVAQLVAHRHPSRTAGVVLCATAMNFRSRAGADRVMWDTLMPVVAKALGMAPAGLRQQLLDRFLLYRRDDGTPAWILDELRRNDPARITEAGIALGRFDSSGWLHELGRLGANGIPTAIVLTTLDTTVGTGRQRALAASIPGSTVHEVAADHRAAVTDSDGFVRALRSAVRAVLPR